MTAKRLHSIGAFIALLLAATAPCGCNFDGHGLLAKHFSRDRKADAQQHWDSVRGGVKLQLAKQQLDSGRIDDAEKTLEQAMATAPQDVQFYIFMTRLRLEQGKLAEARQSITAAAALPGENPEVPYLAGIIAQRYGDLDQALQNYATASAKAPQVPEYQLARIETLVALDRAPEAYEIAVAGLADFDTNVAIRMVVARLAMMLGLRAPAVEQCRQALRLDSEDPTVAIEAGLIFVWADQFEEAVHVLAPLVGALDSTSSNAKPAAGLTSLITPSVRHTLASAALATRRFTDAMQALKPLMNEQKTDTAACTAYARAAIAAGDSVAASEAIDLAHKKSPPTAETLLISAYLAFQRGDFRQSLDLASRAAGLDDGFAEAFCLMGRSAQAVGRTDDARRWYIQTLAIDPAASMAASLLEALGDDETIPYPPNDTVSNIALRERGAPPQ